MLDLKLEIRPLVLGYLAMSHNIQTDKLFKDMDQVVGKLQSKGVPVDLYNSDEIQILLTYWQEQNYVEVKDSYISLTESKRNVFNEDFVTHKLFNRKCEYIPTIVSTYCEVIDNEYKDNSRPCSRLRRYQFR